MFCVRLKSKFLHYFLLLISGFDYLMTHLMKCWCGGYILQPSRGGIEEMGRISMVFGPVVENFPLIISIQCA